MTWSKRRLHFTSVRKDELGKVDIYLPYSEILYSVSYKSQTSRQLFNHRKMDKECFDFIFDLLTKHLVFRETYVFSNDT